MSLKGSTPFAGGRVGCARHPPYESLPHINKPVFFEHGDMARKVSVGNVQLFLDGAEIHVLADHQERHDAQPDAVFKNGMQSFDQIFHFSSFQ